MVGDPLGTAPTVEELVRAYARILAGPDGHHPGAVAGARARFCDAKSRFDRGLGPLPDPAADAEEARRVWVRDWFDPDLTDEELACRLDVLDSCGALEDPRLSLPGLLTARGEWRRALGDHRVGKRFREKFRARCLGAEVALDKATLETLSLLTEEYPRLAAVAVPSMLGREAAPPGEAEPVREPGPRPPPAPRKRSSLTWLWVSILVLSALGNLLNRKTETPRRPFAEPIDYVPLDERLDRLLNPPRPGDPRYPDWRKESEKTPEERQKELDEVLRRLRELRGDQPLPGEDNR